MSRTALLTLLIGLPVGVATSAQDEAIDRVGPWSIVPVGGFATMRAVNDDVRVFTVAK